MKKIGIFVDSNKFVALKQALNYAVYNGWDIKPHTTTVLFMATMVPESEYKKACKKIMAITSKVKMDFHHAN